MPVTFRVYGFRADRGETVITRTVRLEPAILSVITPYGLRHGMDAVRTDAGAVRTNTVRTKDEGRGRTDIGTMSI